jgi:hypothetical protein
MEEKTDMGLQHTLMVNYFKVGIRKVRKKD